MYNYPYKSDVLDNLNLDNLPIVKYKISMWIEHAPTTVPFPHGCVLEGELNVLYRKHEYNFLLVCYVQVKHIKRVCIWKFIPTFFHTIIDIAFVFLSMKPEWTMFFIDINLIFLTTILSQYGFPNNFVMIFKLALMF